MNEAFGGGGCRWLSSERYRPLQMLCLGALSLLLGCGSSSGATLKCDEAAVQSFLGDSCAAGLGDMLSCWMASGQCNATVHANGFDVVFDSGAVLEHTNSSDGLSLGARYVSPSGKQCGAFQTSGYFTNRSVRAP